MPEPFPTPSALDQPAVTPPEQPSTGEFRSLASTGAEAGRGDPPVAPTPSGAQRGRFTIVKPHAQGGLGQVSLARDEKLKRHVALKEIRPDRLGSEALRQRFLTEAEITGLLEHPGIVPVYALDEDEQGQPYYAMRFIQGRTLGDAIREFHGANGRRQPAGTGTARDGEHQPADAGRSPLAFRELLQRFVSVCQTVAYAHSKGVIHRDLKPANIMLGDYGETLVLDWGLAKRIDTPLDITAASECRGGVTPALQTPDHLTEAGQVLGTAAYMSPEQAEGGNVGPAADIYSLGATLYELLTGRLPIRAENWPALQQKIQRGEFPRPRQVNRHVPAALEAVCLKAMTRATTDRYGTALELAKDVDCWLADDPVPVYREPWLARLGRWVRRHRALTASAVAAVLLSVGFLIVVTLLVNAQNETLAQKNEDLEQANTQERAARDYAQTTIEEMTSEEALRFLETQPELRPEQRQFLKQAVGYYQNFAGQVATDEPGRRRQARAYERMAVIQSRLGAKREAEAAYRQAITRFGGLAADFPKNAEYRRELAGLHNNLGVLLESLGRLAEAEAALRRAAAARQQLVADFPTTAEYRRDLAATDHNLGLTLVGLGRFDEAEAAVQQALAVYEGLASATPVLLPSAHELARTQNTWGTLLRAQGRLTEADAAFRQALARYEKLHADAPAAPVYRQELAGIHNNLGLLLAARRQWADAESAHHLALSLCQRLAADFPTVPAYRRDLARHHLNLGVLYVTLGRGGQAEAAFHQTLALYRKLADDFPAEPSYRRELAGSYNNLGRLLAQLNKPADAETAYRAALVLNERLVVAYPTAPDYASDLGRVCANLAHALVDRDQPKAAIDLSTRAIALLTPIVEKELRLEKPREALRNAHFGRARACKALNLPAEAAQAYGAAAALTDLPRDRFEFDVQRARMLLDAGDPVGAVALARTAAGQAPPAEADPDTIYNLACICSLSSAALKNDHVKQEAAAAYAVVLLRIAFARGYSDLGELRSDEELDPLRAREDFKKLLADLEAGKKNPK